MAPSHQQINKNFFFLCCVSRYLLIYSPLHAESDHQCSSGLYDFSPRLLISFPESPLLSSHSNLFKTLFPNLWKEVSLIWFSFSQVFRSSPLPFKIGGKWKKHDSWWNQSPRLWAIKTPYLYKPLFDRFSSGFSRVYSWHKY